jgi:hypothetical protein
MAKIMNYAQFIEDVAKGNFKPYVKRFQELAGIRPLNEKTYLVEITFDFGAQLTEHEVIKKFKKTNKRYYFHPEETSPPVKAHYHVIGAKGNQELYAVSIDGTAHHRKNKGVLVPRKEADELRAMGVAIPPDNIIEHIDDNDSIKTLLTESLNTDCVVLHLEFVESDI